MKISFQIIPFNLDQMQPFEMVEESTKRCENALTRSWMFIKIRKHSFYSIKSSSMCIIMYQYEDRY